MKAPSLLSIGPHSALTVEPLAISMLIGLAEASGMELTVELVKFTVPKLANGSTPVEEDGASAITSAEARDRDGLVAVVVVIQPRLESVSTR